MFRVATMAFVLTLAFVSSPARAQEAESRVVDQSFAFFTLDNNSKSVNGKPRDDGWTLKADYRVFGKTSKRSAFRFVVKKGKKKIGETLCEVSAENQQEKFASGPPAFYVVGCRDRDQRIKQTGPLTVDVHFIDDDTDQESLIGSHDLVVRSVKRVRGNGQPDAPHHYVDRHSEALSSFMYLQHNRADHPFGRLGRSFSSMSGLNQVVLLINVSNDEEHRSIPSDTHLRCSVDGERVEMPHDQVTGRETRQIWVVQTWGKGRREESDAIQFRQHVLKLPLSFASEIAEQTHERWYPLEGRNERYAYLNDHPGNWECEWRKDRDVIRTIRFTVGEDGKVAPHPEQAAGLQLGPNGYFVETEIPKKGSGWDSRVVKSSVVKGAFLGRGFRSDEGRKLSRALPNVGKPVPRAR